MNELTREKAFEVACTELRRQGIGRKPGRELCTEHTTEIGRRKLLYLNDEKGRRGRICAIWMDGPKVGELTQRKRRIELKFVKERRKDFEYSIREAKAAEKRGDQSAK